MYNKGLVFLSALLLVSCSTPRKLINADEGVVQLRELKHIVISTWSEQRFSGILGFQIQKSRVHFNLLDATGIKLLEASSTQSGSIETITGIPRLVDSSLPEILADALWDIYIHHPQKLPCSTDFFSVFCEKKLDDMVKIKYSRIGPFTRWKTEYSLSNNDIFYSVPWYGLTISLKDISQ